MSQPPEWERGLAAGIVEAKRHLEVVRKKNFNNRVVRGYAAGIAAGTMRWCLRQYGPRLTYDLFSGLADEALEQELPKGN